MRAPRLAVTVLLFVLAGLLCADAAPLHVLAYAPQETTPADLQAAAKNIDELAIDCYTVTALGNIHGSTPKPLIDFARSHHIKTYAVVSNFGDGDFDPAIAHSILADRRATDLMTQTMLSLAQENHYDGLDLDIEGIAPSDRDNFTAFVLAFAKACHAQHLTLIVSVPAADADTHGNDWTGGFDYGQLSVDADLLQVMAYDQYGPWSAPGPVADAGWVDHVFDYLISVSAPDRLNLGLPAYGYDWNLTQRTAKQIDWRDIPALLKSAHPTVEEDPATHSVKLTYTDSQGDSHIAWYETAPAIRHKVDLAARQKLAGVSVWALGMEDASFWRAVHAGAK